MKFEIFTNDNCQYCESAKALLKQVGATFEERSLADKQFREELIRRLPHVRTLPQIFYGETYIGGFEDLQALHNNGKLVALHEQDTTP